MKHTLTPNTLTLEVNESERAELREIFDTQPGYIYTTQCEAEFCEILIANSELDWIDPAETGDLTSAPMLGTRDENGSVQERWAFMEYQLRSFLTDLLETGKAVFVS